MDLYSKAIGLSLKPPWITLTISIDLDPSNSTYLNNRAAAKIQIGDFSGALNDCRSALKVDPTFIKAHIRASKCYLNLGQVQEAVSELELANYTCASNQALKDNLPMIQRDLDNCKKIEFYINKANEFVAQENYHDAMIHFESAFMQIDGSLKIVPGGSMLHIAII